MGLVIGVELSVEGDSVYSKCLEEGLLINCTQGNILRIMPPMNVTKLEIDKAISILDKVLAKV
jgi:acetylornithine/N-succinyldiaminopimelate aminotransferase